MEPGHAGPAARDFRRTASELEFQCPNRRTAIRRTTDHGGRQRVSISPGSAADAARRRDRGPGRGRQPGRPLVAGPGRPDQRLSRRSPFPGGTRSSFTARCRCRRNATGRCRKFGCEDVRIQNSLVSLYRRPDVLVEVSGVAELADVKTAADERPGRPGRPVRSFYADMAAAARR